jgi:hypothetical protein
MVHNRKNLLLHWAHNEYLPMHDMMAKKDLFSGFAVRLLISVIFHLYLFLDLLARCISQHTGAKILNPN